MKMQKFSLAYYDAIKKVAVQKAKKYGERGADVDVTATEVTEKVYDNYIATERPITNMSGLVEVTTKWHIRDRIEKDETRRIAEVGNLELFPKSVQLPESPILDADLYQVTKRQLENARMEFASNPRTKDRSAEIIRLWLEGESVPNIKRKLNLDDDQNSSKDDGNDKDSREKDKGNRTVRAAIQSFMRHLSSKHSMLQAVADMTIRSHSPVDVKLS